jgi:two-component system nitrogen regulation response regulator NtrX
MGREAMKAFLNYTWPGNVSELMNVIERFVIMVEDDEIGASHLNLLVEARELESMPGLHNHPTLGQAALLFEKKFIHRALTKNRWDLAKTAAELDLNGEALKEKIKAFNITLFD